MPLPNSEAAIPDPTQYNLTGMQPPSALQTATAIQGAPNDPSILALKPEDRDTATQNLENIVARGTGKSVTDWRNASLPALVSPYASFDTHIAAVRAQIAKLGGGDSMETQNLRQQLQGLVQPPEPEAGSIDARELERSQNDSTYNPNPNLMKQVNAFRLPAAPQVSLDPRFLQFRTAPKPLASATKPSTFPQPPRL